MSGAAVAGIEPKRRERAIDLFKGLLIVGMVYCHTLQFFSDPVVYPSISRWIDFFNLITFSGFVFSFGYVSQLAYYSKPFRSACPRMLTAALKTLLAFYVSGTAFRVFHDGAPLQWDTIRPIMLLKDIPGWSEFLVSFTYLMILGLVLFVPLRWLSGRKWLGFLAAGLLLAGTLFPYGAVHVPQLGLLVGTRDFASFPPVQYFPYYLLGILFAKYRIRFDWLVLAGSVLATGLFAANWRYAGELPSRFPPSLFWIIGAAIILYGYYLLARVLERIPYAFGFLESMGRNVLLYLVLSNLLIFTVKSSRPDLLVGSGGGLLYAAGWLAVCGFCSWIVTKRTR
uniref:acyltransferase n=1 Tax=Paenibacillus terrae TaxID=159743 RepID=UPI0011A83F0E|nr:acyltransferase [Paenibacillus terrae]